MFSQRARLPLIPNARLKPRRWPLSAALLLVVISMSLSGCHMLGAPAYYRATRTYRLPTVAKLPPVSKAVRRALASATSVQFFAPQGCKAAAQDGRTAVHGLRCGQLMAEFEAAVARQGARVHSWRDTNVAGDPGGVEVRVTEATSTFLPGKRLVSGPTQWSAKEVLPDGRDGPLRMRDPMSVDRRCDARYRSLLDKPVRATALLVTVTGQGGKPVLWRWQRTFSPAGTPDGRFLAEHTVRVRPRVAFPKVIGEALLVCGAVFAAVPLFMGGESAIGGDFMVMGAGMGGAGLLTAIAAPRAMLSYPSPDPLMCQKRDAHWLNAQAPAPVDARAARIFASRAVSHLWGAKQ